MIESPVLDEVRAFLRLRYLRESVTEALDVRFGPVPAERIAGLKAVNDEARLRELHRFAITCPDLCTFVAALATPARPSEPAAE
jgi:hypothetical protein